METDRENRIRNNEERVETMRTSSPRLEALNARLVELESSREDTSAHIDALQQNLETLEEEGQERIDRLEEDTYFHQSRINNARDAIVGAHEDAQTGLDGLQERFETNLANWRSMGYIE